MKTIPVHESVGTVLCHDITRIIPGDSKGPLFKRGHIITTGDIETLLDIGKASLYVYDPRDGYIHEDEAAIRLANAAAGENVELSDPAEGKVTLTAAVDGLLYIDVQALLGLNSMEDVTFGTIHTHQFVKKGRALGGTRVVPLAVPGELIVKAESLCGNLSSPVVEVRQLARAKVGVVTTGSEVYSGRIKDGFGPVLQRKFNFLGSEIMDQIFVSDEIEMTVQAILLLIEKGADLIAVTGGMSVDPDDQTPASIRQTGADVVCYGAPTYPGAMFLLAYLNDVPIIGLPGCVMYYKASIFELIVPRILAGERLTRKDIIAFGHGGFCEGCKGCRYPVCGFGKV